MIKKSDSKWLSLATAPILGQPPSLFLLLLLCISQLSIALESDSDQPIMIEADSVELDDDLGVSTYTGNVVVIQGSIQLNADRVTVTRSSANSHHLLAEGNPVRFTQETEDKGVINGNALQAEYDSGSDILFLIGDAHLKQGNDTFESDRINYDQTKAIVRAGTSAKGKQRVKASIQPDKL